jgi:hypothetical protein
MCAHSFERVFKPHEGPEHLDCDLIKRLKYFGEAPQVHACGWTLTDDK